MSTGNLNQGQKQCFDAILEGQVCWIWGPPGYGKSFLISKTTSTLVEMGKTVAITAMTGAAASILQGAMTLHRFTGTGQQSMKMHLPQFVDSREKISERTKKIIQNTDVLIVDEAGMLSRDAYNHLDQFLRHVRGKRGKRYGGMQVILIGDPGQCPPCATTEGPGMKRDELVPQFSTFNYPDEHTPVFILNQPMRNAEDPVLANCLLALISPNPKVRELAVKLINQRTSNKETLLMNEVVERAHQENAIIITPTNNRVAEYINMEKQILKGFGLPAILIPSPEKLYTVDTLTKQQIEEAGGLEGIVREDKEIVDRRTFQNELSLYPRQIAKITLNGKCSSTNEQFANGELVRFIKFCKETDTVEVVRIRDSKPLSLSRMEHKTEFEEEVGRIGYLAFPIVPGIAVNVHKVQGQTLNKVIIDPHNLYCFGKDISNMIYVMTSRVRKFEDIILTSPLNAEDVKQPKVQENLQALWDNEFMNSYPKPDIDLLKDSLKDD
jgi:ATP-dependent DNA helicase PIF1